MSESDPGRSGRRGNTSGRCSMVARARCRKGRRGLGLGLQPVRGLMDVGPRWRVAAGWVVRAGGGWRLRGTSLLAPQAIVRF